MLQETMQMHSNLASMSDHHPSESNNFNPNSTKKEEWNDETALGRLKEICSELSSLRCEDSLGRSALHYASWKCSVELVTFLLARLHNADARDAHAKTPLHYACETGRVSNIRALIHHHRRTKGHDTWLDARDDRQMTPMMSAASNGHLAALSVFFETEMVHHIDAWRKDIDGRNALHHAAMNGHTSCAEFLIRTVGDASYASELDKDGRTAVKLASRQASTKKRIESEIDALTGATKSTNEVWLTVVAFAFIALGMISGFIVTLFMGEE